MEISEQQIFQNFADESRSLALACPVNRLPLPGSAAAKKMSVGSGRQLSMLFDPSNPLGVFSRILMESSRWTNSEEYCWIWQVWDTPLGFSAFQLTPLAQNICGGEPLLLPTPNAGNFNDGESLETWEKRREKNKAKGINGNGQGTPLAIAVKKLWPTPQAHDAAKGNPGRVGRFGTAHGGRNLTDEVMNPKLWPTPIAMNDSGGQALCKWGGSGARKKLKTMVSSDVLNGSLNPRFVEELMGYEIDHTALKRSATPSSRNKRFRSLKRSHV